MGAPTVVASPGGPGRELGAPNWLTLHDSATGIRFHSHGTSRRVGSHPRGRTRGTAVSGGGAEEREPTGREAGLRLGRVGSLHRSRHHSGSGIRFHAREQQRGSVLATRSNAVSGVTRVEAWPGLATADKRGPFGFSRWG